MTEDPPLYKRVSTMEPMFPSHMLVEIESLALTLVGRSSKLSRMLHPVTRERVTGLLRTMNCYYSNLIEGQTTHPRDIERALKRDYSKDPEKAALQKVSFAHIRAQEAMEARLREDSGWEMCSPGFMSWIHEEFYSHLPPELRRVRGTGGRWHEVIPGRFRTGVVEVGRHIPPAPDAIPDFLSRFESVYSPSKCANLRAIVAAAASHHRLAWIHPFVDGNGRVTRLHSQAYFIRTGIDASGLWSISRGLARNRQAYYGALASADMGRQGALDGRGNLSDKGLAGFCKFFLEPNFLF